MSDTLWPYLTLVEHVEGGRGEVDDLRDGADEGGIVNEVVSVMAILGVLQRWYPTRWLASA